MAHRPGHDARQPGLDHGEHRCAVNPPSMPYLARPL